jgi:hypothetical protein
VFQLGQEPALKRSDETAADLQFRRVPSTRFIRAASRFMNVRDETI